MKQRSSDNEDMPVRQDDLRAQESCKESKAADKTTKRGTAER